MKRTILLCLTAAAVALTSATTANAAPPGDHAMGSQIAKHEGRQATGDGVRMAGETVPGMDVSSYQGNVDWQAAYNAGARFAIVKATESTGYTNPYFTQQYNGSYNVGMIRGAYHFALPNESSGATQANYFLANGGGWSADGKTLPGALDMEYNPYGATCYGLSQASMAAWVRDFSNTYYARTSKRPVIYTSTTWWRQCVGTQGAFADTNALWIANYASTPGTLPYNWTYYTFWQHADGGRFPGDQNLFNGPYSQLQVFARNHD
ncbi:lysozyme [Amycolatopsis sp. cg5]|uniref:lysozyme n=1 Tax=Amycolatopsis sp. cg5 TaxID=3238802 RepID=UPI0035235CB6